MQERDDSLTMNGTHENGTHNASETTSTTVSAMTSTTSDAGHAPAGGVGTSYTATTSTILLVFVILFALFIEFGNALTIISAIVYRRLRRPKYLPVISLAVADLLVGVAAMVFACKQYSGSHVRVSFSIQFYVISHSPSNIRSYYTR